MRWLCLTGAVLVVLVTNGWAVWQSSRNQTEPSGGTLWLSERALSIQPVALESSVTVLRLHWRTERANGERFGPATWLNTNKLIELGFDCTIPVQSPQAARHYQSVPARRVFLVLECQVSSAAGATPDDQTAGTLMVIDAGLDPAALRQRYPDPAKHAICRGTVRLHLRRHGADGRLLNPPQLAGWVNGLAPSLIYVPRPVNQLLTRLPRTFADFDESAASDPPPFKAQVRWGINYEPWIDQLQAVPTLSP